MSTAAILDQKLIQNLPLPLAQLYRRAHNARTPLERYLMAFCLWEASLKLLSSTAIMVYAAGRERDADAAARLKNLARPALGHWWELVRCLTPILARSGASGFKEIQDVLLSKRPVNLPRAAGLDAILREELSHEKPAARSTVRLQELFDRLVQLRNEDMGHGATVQRKPEFHERLAPALLAGVADILDAVPVLAGRRLIHVADVRRLASDNWLIERFEFHGEAARRLESAEAPATAQAATLPSPGRLYLQDAAETSFTLAPLVLYDLKSDQVMFLNTRRGDRRADYLSYATGDTARRDDLTGEQEALLARLLGQPVDAAALGQWQQLSQAHDKSAEPAAVGSKTVGDFELLSRIGRGGMGVVYRAFQPSLGRQVALKMLLAAGDPKADARFTREIQALGRVEHPHVVKVYTSGAVGDQWFYAMELIDGADLAAVCTHLTASSATEVSDDDWGWAVNTACDEQRRSEVTLSDVKDDARTEPPTRPVVKPEQIGLTGGRGHIARVVEIMRQAAEGAHALHEAGVVHRDIKPGNIMLTADGHHTVLMDLGLAQLADEAEGRLTRTREFVGTLRYASPEQVLAAGRLDRRADVYSLGATLWELLTLRPLFGATDQTPTPELMLKIQSTDPERVRKLNPRVPPDLGAIVHRCLEKDRARRYQTAGELAADLSRWQRGEPVLAQPPSLGYLLRKQARRYRVPLALVGFVLAVVVAAVAGSFIEITAAYEGKKTAYEGEKQAREDADRQRGIAQDQTKAALDNLARAQEALLLAARAFHGQSALETSRGDPRSALLDEWRAYDTLPIEPSDVLRQDGDKVRHVSLMGLPFLSQATGKLLLHDGTVSAVAFSPDGRTVLTGSRDNTARLWRADTGQPLATLHHDNYVSAVAFSPDGRTVLTEGEDKTARLWDVPPAAPDEPARLRAWVEVRTAKTLDKTGTWRDLTHAEWLSSRNKLQAQGGDFETPPDPRRWHAIRAVESEQEKNWFAAVFHLKRLLALDPGNLDLPRRRAAALANLRRSAEAAPKPGPSKAGH